MQVAYSMTWAQNKIGAKKQVRTRTISTFSSKLDASSHCVAPRPVQLKRFFMAVIIVSACLVCSKPLLAQLVRKYHAHLHPRRVGMCVCYSANRLAYSMVKRGGRGGHVKTVYCTAELDSCQSTRLWIMHSRVCLCVGCWKGCSLWSKKN